MKIANRTPFCPATFRRIARDGRVLQVVVLRGTFDLVPGEPLRPSAEQVPPFGADEFYGEAVSSSVRVPNDIATSKPACDIIVNAVAYPPGGEPLREWTVGVQVGKLEKTLMVVGPRVWTHHAVDGWTLSRAEPATHIPITYERAFGGRWERDGKQRGHAANPVGRGFVDEASLDRSLAIPAPNVVPLQAPNPTLNGKHEVAGFSAIARSWTPRIDLAGTYDKGWELTRAPRLPEDFDDRFNNAAHPDLVYDGFLQGDETLRLDGLHPELARVETRLPNWAVGVSIADERGASVGAPCKLDTLFVDVEAMQVALVWRVALPVPVRGVARIDTVLRTLGELRAMGQQLPVAHPG